jgi:HlyD family secretion protein/epimerase transport system membrane fusion protein
MAESASEKGKPKQKAIDRPMLRRSLRGPVLIGTLVVLLFFAGLGGWAATAPLASAAIASGVISPDGNRRTVQHLEGGIIRDILVREGDRVEAGDPLIVLSDAQPQASHQLLMSQYRMLAATRARLRAEQLGRPAVAFPDWLQAERDDPDVRTLLATQAELFQTRRQTLSGRVDILRQRIAQLSEEITGLEAEIASQDTQLGLIDEEIGDVSGLVAQGLERRPRLLGLQRQRAEIEGALAQNRAAIARAEQSIGEAEIQILSLRAQRADEVAAEINDVQTELLTLEERIAASEDVLQRLAVIAPVGGTVMGMRFHSTGGVVGPGEPILDIVPLGEDLLVDARVSPLDIDVVHPGLTAQVHLSAYPQRNLPRIEGTVRQVSADSFEDEATGQNYYLARVEVDRERLATLDRDIELLPGMPAEVMIYTGERTVLDYLADPVIRTVRRSMREG